MADQDKAHWTKLVADFEASDLSQREFARERMVSLSNLRYWIYRLRKDSRPLVTERSDGEAEREPAKKGLILKPVQVVAFAPKARQGEDGAALLEMALPSGTRLRFPAGTDPESHDPSHPCGRSVSVIKDMDASTATHWISDG